LNALLAAELRLLVKNLYALWNLIPTLLFTYPNVCCRLKYPVV
jgi:hypothetical protein